MFHQLQRQITTVFFIAILSTSTLWSSSKDHNLSDAQLHAVMGIITNFILSESPKKVLHFSSSATVTVAENQLSALTVVASDAGGTVTYSLSAGDSGLFSINSSTGVIVFNTAPDFETRDTYTFTVTATDSSGNVSTQDVTINISDVVEFQAPKKTGQTKSYNGSGTEVLDNSIKDDGFYQKGTTPSYTRDDVSNIVTDHITGLQWTDDANVSNSGMKKQWLTTSNYDICKGQNGQTQDTAKCTDTSGDTATTYCTTLTLGGFTDWRLPNIDELLSIADISKRNPAIDTTAFENVVSYYYWSSITVVGNEDYAWAVGFDDGSDVWGGKSYSLYVRCVRDGQP
jgi:hypothetical protein